MRLLELEEEGGREKSVSQSVRFEKGRTHIPFRVSEEAADIYYLLLAVRDAHVRLCEEDEGFARFRVLLSSNFPEGEAAPSQQCSHPVRK